MILNFTHYMTLAVLMIFQLSCQPETNSYNHPDWTHYHGGPERNQYKHFDQINRDNVSQMELLWEYHSSDGAFVNTQIQCNPLVINGVVFGTSPELSLFALDGKTGTERWRFIPDDFEGRNLGVNRGLNYWRKGDDERVLFCAGPNLYAVNALSGEPISTFGENGKVDLKKGLGRNLDSTFYSNNSPGAIYGDLIIVGGRTSEGADHAPGHIRAYNVISGDMEWIFHTIPAPGEYGADTWPDSAYWKSGGANSWSGFSVDSEEGIVYAPTGSASFDFYGGDRHGQNLFANSIVALDAQTGERIWHFQVRHHDLWDRDLPAPPNLITIDKDGATIKALAQITKSGDLFVLNRLTGEPIYPVEEVAASPSTLEGEQAWPTQPVPTGYPKFSRANLTKADLATRSDEAKAYGLQALQGASYGEFVPPSLDRQILFPGMDGGGEWGGAAYDPNESVLFVNSNEMTWQIKMNKYEPVSIGQSVYQANCQSCHAEDFKGNQLFGNVPSLVGVTDRKSPAEMARMIQSGKGVMPAFSGLSTRDIREVIHYIDKLGDVKASDQEGSTEWPYPYFFNGYGKFLAPDGLPIIRPPWGQLTAVDMNKAEILWQVPLGNIDSLNIDGHPVTGTENYGGPVVTSGGLVFIAATADEKLRVFDKETGEKLWETQLPTGGYATPATYMVDGRQMIVIACGGGKLGSDSGDSYLAFGLPE